jgi:uncharacterized protein (TIGR00255 family)
MSVYSMTGYASAGVSVASASTGAALRPDSRSEAKPEGSPPSGAVVNAEVRSVNGRFLDLSLKLPEEMRGLEPALRELVAAAVKRGKVELRLVSPREAAGTVAMPGAEALMNLARVESMVQGWLPKAAALSVHEALQWCSKSTAIEAIDEPALQAAREALAGLRSAREREGARLAKVLVERLQHLRALAKKAEPLLPAVVQKQRERFLERWNEALAASGAANNVPSQALQERALNEAAAFAIRIDVAEELARLASHLDEIERLLKAGGEVGKRLDFLIQELHREANTLGSKSAALELTAISVDMKVAIEQMREQVQNIE